MTTFESPPVQADQRLYRSQDDRLLGGVCAAVGRYTRTDPVIWRVVLLALVFFGGAGALLYALGYLLIPMEAGRTSYADRFLHRYRHRLRSRNGGLLVAALVVFVALASDRAVLWPLGILAAVGILVHRERSAAGAGAAPAAAPLPDPGTDLLAPDGLPSPGPAPAEELPPRRLPRRRSRLGRITLSVAALTAGVLALTGAAAANVVAAALLVVGGGLVVGTWYGRSRALIAVGLLLAVALGPVAVAESVPGGGTGRRSWSPDHGGQAFTLTAGDAHLDLTGMTAGDTGTVTVRLGAGHLLLTVPATRGVRLHAHVGVGQVDLGEDPRGGAGVDVTRDEVLPGDGPPLVVDVAVVAGQVEVLRG